MFTQQGDRLGETGAFAKPRAKLIQRRYHQCVFANYH